MQWAIRDDSEWHTRFAFLPKQVAELKWVWLARYERRLVSSNEVCDTLEHRLPGAAESVQVLA